MSALAVGAYLAFSATLTAPSLVQPPSDLMSNTRTYWESFTDSSRRSLGCTLRDNFFFQIPSVLMGEKLEQQKFEQAFFSHFFDTDQSLDPNFQDQEKIRESISMFDQEVLAKTPEGRDVLFRIRVLEINPEDSMGTYNLVNIMGNHSTIDNNAAGIYPFLASFLRHNSVQNPKAGRFFLVSQYNMMLLQEDEMIPYKAESLAEAGFILVQVLGAITDTYGKIEQAVAHSLGSIILASALKDLERNREFIPRHILFDRGPSSIELTSQYYWGGSILFFLAQQSDWAVDVAQEISDFSAALGKDAPDIVISGVADDFYFPKEANLALSSKIEKLKESGKTTVLYFKIPLQVFHERAHHNLRPDYLHKGYLISPSSSALEENQTLSDYVVKRSLFN